MEKIPFVLACLALSVQSSDAQLASSRFEESPKADVDACSCGFAIAATSSKRGSYQSTLRPLGALALLLVARNLATAFSICGSRAVCAGPLNGADCFIPVMSDAPMNEARGPWEFGRFLKTADFYDVFRPRIPIVSDAMKQVQKAIRGYQFKPQEVIWSQSGSGLSEVTWGPLDDVVMGGASKSELEPGQMFSGRWKGSIITAGGGFAGIRTKGFEVPLDWSNCRGVKLRVRGDGQRYKFILRDDYDWNGVAFTHSFDTVASSGNIQTIEIPFSSFKPIQLARSIPFRVLNSQSITAMQFTLSKFEYDGMLNPAFREGSFELLVDSIELY